MLPFSLFKESFGAFFSNRRLRATALVDMATYFAFGAFETFLPLVLLSRGMGRTDRDPVRGPDADHRPDKTVLWQDCRQGR